MTFLNIHWTNSYPFFFSVFQGLFITKVKGLKNAKNDPRKNCHGLARQ